MLTRTADVVLLAVYSLASARGSLELSVNQFVGSRTRLRLRNIGVKVAGPSTTVVVCVDHSHCHIGNTRSIRGTRCSAIGHELGVVGRGSSDVPLVDRVIE